MEQRVSLITLGVRDVSRAQAFYQALGWHLDGGVDDETDHVAFFQAGGMILALWDRGKLAQDSGVEDTGGWGGVTLAHNVRSPAEVDAVLEEARAAGAQIARSGAATVWGGYSGVFIDPDGHPWEVAHNPAWTVHEDGRTTLAVPAERPDAGEGPPAAALHVTNGDGTVPGLRGTGLADAVLVWRDVLHEGPVPDVPDEELRHIRAAFLAGEQAADLGTVGELAERDRRLEAHREGDYVLWFEADLYDQLQLVQILARLHRLAVRPGRITLICIGEHLGIAHFGGLGQLSSEQLSRLPATAATTLTDAALERASEAWAALRAPDPSRLGEIAATPSDELRFLAEAFDRLSREYPSTRDGLSLTERRILAAVAEGAPTAGDAFVHAAAKEARPFLGDTWCFDRMALLVRAPVPLLGAEPVATAVGRQTRLHLTDAGRRVLDGREDHVALNGIDRWIGGVHLVGRDVPWRWNEATEAITGVGRLARGA